MTSKPRVRLTPDQIGRMVQQANATGDRAGVAKGFGVSTTTVDKYVRLVAEQPWIYRPSNRRDDLRWMRWANCRGARDAATGKFFTEWPVSWQILVCRDCPVRLKCLEYGLDGPLDVNRKSEEGSVYGGVPPKQLAELQRQRSGVAS